MLRFTMTLLLLVPFVSILGQENSELGSVELENLIKAFPKEEAVLLNSTIDYTFKRDRSSNPLKVIEKSNDTYIALQDNAKVLARKFYDNYSELTSHRFSSPNSYSVEHFQRCGNYESEGIFYHDAKVCSFFMGMKKQSDQIVLKTTKTFLDPRYFARVFIGSDYGVVERVIRFHVPDYVKLEIIEENFTGFDTEKREYNEANGKGRIIEFKARNIPGSIGLDNLPGSSCVFPHLIILVKSFSYTEKQINIVQNNDDLYRWYKSLIGNAQLSWEIKELTEELIADKNSDSTKIASIYSWVQSNIRYIAFEDGIAALKPETPSKVFTTKYGDCKGMANLLKAMLVNAGFDARLCWIGTGHVCYSRDIPSVVVDNHMICAVKMDDKFVFLDPTVSYTLLGEVHEGIQGKSAIVEDGENYLIIRVPEILPQDNFMQVNNEISIEVDDMLLDGTILLGGMQKYSFQYFMDNLRSPDKGKMVRYFLTQTDNNYTLNEFDHTPSDSIVRNFEINYNMVLENNVIDLGDELLLSLDLDEDFNDAAIDSTRAYAYAFDFRRQNKQRTILNIPEGFVVKIIPDPIDIDAGNFKIFATYEITDSTLIYSKEILIREKT
ncbi:MAG: transglutaminase domain-containing protein, partial [Chlorobi bacterium]|nr:transglutaminase domain-containing protein [Chlorobiota bacterium]